MHKKSKSNLKKCVAILLSGSLCIAGFSGPCFAVLAQEDVTATKLEFREALEEGAEFMHLMSVLRITEDGLVAVDVDVVEDENGISYEENMLSRHSIEADTVILAIGQGPESTLSAKAQIATNLRGLFAVDENGMTNIPGVFAAGDVVSGPKTVVEAVAHTKMVAEQMIKYCYEKKK